MRPLIAFLLSIIPGLGHIYQGHRGAGCLVLRRQHRLWRRADRLSATLDLRGERSFVWIQIATMMNAETSASAIDGATKDAIVLQRNFDRSLASALFDR